MRCALAACSARCDRRRPASAWRTPGRGASAVAFGAAALPARASRVALALRRRGGAAEQEGAREDHDGDAGGGVDRHQHDGAEPAAAARRGARPRPSPGRSRCRSRRSWSPVGPARPPTCPWRPTRARRRRAAGSTVGVTSGAGSSPVISGETTGAAPRADATAWPLLAVGDENGARPLPSSGARDALSSRLAVREQRRVAVAGGPALALPAQAVVVVPVVGCRRDGAARASARRSAARRRARAARARRPAPPRPPGQLGRAEALPGLAVRRALGSGSGSGSGSTAGGVAAVESTPSQPRSSSQSPEDGVQVATGGWPWRPARGLRAAPCGGAPERACARRRGGAGCAAPRSARCPGVQRAAVRLPFRLYIVPARLASGTLCIPSLASIVAVCPLREKTIRPTFVRTGIRPRRARRP